jgi:hypothetical protein
MRAPSYETVDKQAQEWESEYQENNTRGQESILFSACGEQWMGSVESERELSNKETLVFNITQKFDKNFKAQTQQVEFTIGLWAKNDSTEAEQTNTYRLLLNHLILGKQFKDRMDDALKKSADYGYSVLELNYDYDNDETLCLSPVIRFHEDPQVAFYDKAAKSPYRTDGRFVGLRNKISKEEFLSSYPEYEDDCMWLNDQENDFIRYWYVDKKPAMYVALKGGVYKRKDLITIDDDLATDEDTKNKKSGLYKKPLEKKGFKKCIYYVKYCNRKRISKPVLFPTDRLPVPYHPSFTVWTDDGYRTYPLTYPLQGVQQFMNFIHSQLATIVKNSTGDKWILAPEHVATEQAEKYAKNINQMEGAMVFPQPPNVPAPRREQAADIPYALMEFSQSLTQLANDVSGAYFNPQNSDNVVVSGKALKEITNSMNVMQINAIAMHIGFVNECAAILKSMIPNLYTEERLLIARKADGSSQPIYINKPNGNGGLINNIKDLNDSYIYELTAQPTTEMVRENSLKYLMMIYGIAPQAFTLTGDIFARNLNTPDAQEIELRLKAGMDQNLIKVSQGEITQEQYQKTQMPAQQAKQQQMQLVMQEQQAKTAKLQNEAQAVMIRAQGDGQKAQAMVQDANTKAQVAITNASIQQANTQIQAQKVMGEQQQRATQQSLDETHMQYEREKSVYERADNMLDKALQLHSINTSTIPQPQQDMNTDDAADTSQAD